VRIKTLPYFFRQTIAVNRAGVFLVKNRSENFALHNNIDSIKTQADFYAKGKNFPFFRQALNDFPPPCVFQG